MRVITILLIAAVLTGCGQKGPLIIPQSTPAAHTL